MSASRNEPRFVAGMATVHGVATARLAGNESDATLLIQRHLEEDVAAGATLPEAWSNLFTAAVIALCDEVETRARSARTHPQNLLTQSAMRHAMDSA